MLLINVSPFLQHRLNIKYIQQSHTYRQSERDFSLQMGLKAELYMMYGAGVYTVQCVWWCVDYVFSRTFCKHLSLHYSVSAAPPPPPQMRAHTYILLSPCVSLSFTHTFGAAIYNGKTELGSDIQTHTPHAMSLTNKTETTTANIATVVSS